MIFDEQAKETFSRKIEEYVQKHGDGYIEAIISLNSFVTRNFKTSNLTLDCWMFCGIIYI